MKVREVIRHGSYHHERVVEMSPTWASFVDMLSRSPYGGAETPESMARNQYVAMAFADLLVKGQAQLGWAAYWITSSGQG